MDRITKHKKLSAILLLFVFGLSLVANFFATSTISYADVLQTLPADKAQIWDGTNDVTNKQNLSNYLSLKVKYDWSIPDGTVVKPGDTINFTIPQNVNAQFNSGEGNPYVIPAKMYDGTTTGLTVGEAVIPYNSHEGTITFNDNISKYNTGISGLLTFDATGVDNSGSSSGSGGDSGSGSGSGTGTGDDSDDGIFSSKHGWINEAATDANKVPHELYWNIGLNVHNYTVTNETLTDHVADNQKFIENSMSVTSDDGKEQVPYKIEYNDDDTEFKMTFDSTISKKISLLYRTEFTNQDSLLADGDYVWYNYSVSHNDNVVNSQGKVMSYAVGDVQANSPVLHGGSFIVTGNNGTVTLTKVDSEDNNKVLSGAVFELLDENGNILNNHLTTNENGQISLKYLKPGNYSLKEITAPSGYSLNNTERTFTVEKNQSEPQSIGMEDTKRADLGRVTLTKTGPDTKTPLSGASFQLEKIGDNGYMNTIGDPQSTDANGQIKIDNLEYGNYQFVETSAPAGYEKSIKPVSFKISDSSTDANVSMSDQEITSGSVTLTKTDSDTKALLSGATFQLEKEDGTKVGDPKVTDSNGQITINNLKFGDYQFVETKAPDNYKKDATPITFTIDKDTPTRTVKMIDYKITSGSGGGTTTPTDSTGSVTLTKSDASTNKVLQGAEFKLLDSKGNEVTGNYITDVNGQLNVAGLKPGKYSFVETKAPEGYELNTKSVEFPIVAGETAKVSMTDTKAPTKPVNPSNPENPGTSNKPTTPTNPETPTEPENPETPIIPGNPGVPA